MEAGANRSGAPIYGTGEWNHIYPEGHSLIITTTFQSAATLPPTSRNMVVKLIAHALDVVTPATPNGQWMRSLNSHEYPEHVPRLLCREDATEEQRNAVLILLHPLAHSEQLARELASERLITSTIARMFGPLYPYWMFSTTR